ncbi:hypothetical protein NDU88_009029 [Pleurodeles waltl]|uniref:Uncharacterized protein n=1 Tax=Pleurodeles waltl TaxID=8319 RepID=A0AAV7PS52_PLEWA|nr:hypothetical protein NDU88_009029 [Pleurodeles waltl]
MNERIVKIQEMHMSSLYAENMSLYFREAEGDIGLILLKLNDFGDVSELTADADVGADERGAGIAALQQRLVNALLWAPGSVTLGYQAVYRVEFVEPAEPAGRIS